MPSSDTYDIIIAGGGTAGCVIAGRLATADATLNILVVEAGPNTRDDPLHTQPSRYLHHLRPDSTTVKFNVAYLLLQCETYQIERGKPTHGYVGPLKISYGGFYPEVGQEFLNVAAQYDKARGLTDDVNDMFECNKYGRWPKWIDMKTGTRSDVPHHYIYPQSSNENLRILTGYQVKRVIFEGNMATGVEYVPTKRFHPDAKSDTLIAKAKRLIVLSAGTFGSPAILERSGLGSSAVLEKIGVQQLVDLPGVGENYQDHQLILAPYWAADTMHTLDAVAQDNVEEIEKWTEQWKENGTGMLATNGLESGIKIRPFKRDLDIIGPDFRKRWLDYYAHSPDKAVAWMGSMSMLTGERPNVPRAKFFAVGWYLEHPMSIGYLHATSADNVDALADFHPGYLDMPADMALHKWSYKRTREFARRMPSYRGEVAVRHPAFNAIGEAAAGDKQGPVPALAPDINYSPEDEQAIEDYIRQAVATAWHSMGTCGMKKREDGGVVDARLNVYGLEGLKIADMSICPSNVAAVSTYAHFTESVGLELKRWMENTYSTAVVIGEKAAVIIAEELGIPMEDTAVEARPGL
ncbi:Alcohol oxidase [Trametes cinnabarina]|uniref:Alcohol oxidase n=1 Tax=Pycnoporus cinnabarinus TaxID=5643 RepID=A0A060S3W5_PYCCI|nr:Alcohol oxidase [Trametes cinnabarina]